MDIEKLEPDHEVAVIGAGLSGIGAAISLVRAGIDGVAIFERSSAIGGTWRDNTYPGVGVDVPSQGYQFSFELKPNWSRIFAPGAEVMTYIDECADRYDVRRLVHFNSEVARREWDERRHLWRLVVSGRVVTARYVVSALGPFLEPKEPALPGLSSFTGTVLRSASWDHTVDLSGKRVAVIGTGASAVQLVPEIAPLVGRLDVYQRTPIWVAPKPDIPMPALVSRLFRQVPPVQRLVRDSTARAMELFLMGVALKHERTAPLNRAGTVVLKNGWYRTQVRDRETRRRLTPDYDFGCKRPSTSNRYLRAFNRSNVGLVTEPIREITASGIQTEDGLEREVDVLVLATGFSIATDPSYFRRYPVVGRAGFDLASFYAEQRARSYEGVTLPGLPNHFMIFGPYGWVGGTWHDCVETSSTHIVRVIREAYARGATSVEVSEEAADRWTQFAAHRLSRSLWARGNCASANSYYYDHHGDTTFVRPTSAREARRASKSFPLDDYEFEAHPSSASAAIA